MGDSSSSSSSCDPLTPGPANLPPNFNANDTFLCGINVPSTAQPLETLKICCTQPIEVQDGCFQYCPPTGRESTIFSNCVEAHVNVLDESGFKVYCNAGTEVKAVEGESGVVGRREGVRAWKVLVGVVVGGVLAGVLG